MGRSLPQSADLIRPRHEPLSSESGASAWVVNCGPYVLELVLDHTVALMFVVFAKSSAEGVAALTRFRVRKPRCYKHLLRSGFRGRKVAASLKPGGENLDHRRLRGFRGRKVAASLKRGP